MRSLSKWMMLAAVVGVLGLSAGTAQAYIPYPVDYHYTWWGPGLGWELVRDTYGYGVPAVSRTRSATTLLALPEQRESRYRMKSPRGPFEGLYAALLAGLEQARREPGKGPAALEDIKRRLAEAPGGPSLSNANVRESMSPRMSVWSVWQ